MIRQLYQKAIFIGKLSYDATLKDLQSVFPTASKIDLPLNKFNQGNRGFAFVELSKDEEADAFINNPPSIRGTTVYVEERKSVRAYEKITDPTSTLYFGKLPTDVSREEIAAIAPSAISVRVIPKEFGAIAFADFNSIEDATHVLEQNPDLEIRGQSAFVSYGKGTLNRGTGGRFDNQ